MKKTGCLWYILDENLPSYVGITLSHYKDPVIKQPVWLTESTWRIIPVSKWLVTPMYKPSKGHLEGEQPDP